MSNFSFKEIKETTGKRVYPVDIVHDNYVASAEYNEQYDCLDINFENAEYKYRERFFNPTKNVPDWSTPEKELKSTQRRMFHILARFMSIEEAQSIQGDSWKEMCETIARTLMERSQGKTFDLKFIFNKKFEFPELGSFPFIRTEGEKELQYTKWEKENRLIVAKEETPAGDDMDIF